MTTKQKILRRMMAMIAIIAIAVGIICGGEPLMNVLSLSTAFLRDVLKGIRIFFFDHVTEDIILFVVLIIATCFYEVICNILKKRCEMVYNWFQSLKQPKRKSRK